MEIASFFRVAVMIYAIIIILFLGLYIYGFVLFVKLAKRGIKALDIYNKRNSSNIE